MKIGSLIQLERITQKLMELIDLNRTQDIGSNCLLLKLGPITLLIDCGMHPKKIGIDSTPDLTFLDNTPPDAIILTHAHLDHIGSLPLVLQKYPHVPIFTSHATAILGPRMLHNSCNVMNRQYDQGLLQSSPLYNHGHVDSMKNNWTHLPLGRPYSFTKNKETIEITFYPSGHVAGAVGCLFNYKNKKIFFTGDVLFEDQLTVPGAAFPKEQCDILITETTRGNTVRKHTRSSEIQRLLAGIQQTMEQGGSCLIPLFALGRLQELMAILHKAMCLEKSIPHYPIFSSGLGLDLVNYMDEVCRKTKSIQFRRKIVKELKVQPMHFKLKPGVLPEKKGIYLLSSGMMVEHTPSYALAASLLHDSKSSIHFVGYCDPDTPGGELLNKQKGQAMDFHPYTYATDCNATIERLDLSAHADREELLSYAKILQPKHIVTTHGDPSSREWFLKECADLLPHTLLSNPTPGVSLSLFS